MYYELKSTAPPPFTLNRPPAPHFIHCIVPCIVPVSRSGASHRGKDWQLQHPVKASLSTMVPLCSKLGFFLCVFFYGFHHSRSSKAIYHYITHITFTIVVALIDIRVIFRLVFCQVGVKMNQGFNTLDWVSGQVIIVWPSSVSVQMNIPEAKLCNNICKHCKERGHKGQVHSR